MPDYSALDNPSILTYVFYPRDDFGICPAYGFDHFVHVAEGVSIHCRFYKADESRPWILYFHGNGEVVSDYEEISFFFLKYKMNLVVADYRGYGKSSGAPTLRDIASDGHIIYESVKKELDRLPSAEQHQGTHHRKRFPQHHPAHCSSWRTCHGD